MKPILKLLASAGAVAVVATVGLVALSPRPAVDIGLLSASEKVRVLAQNLDCTERYVLQDDLSSVFSMKGLDCVDSNNEYLSVRAYETAQGARFSASSWAAGDNRFIVSNEDWYVIGPRPAVETVTDRIEGAEDPSQTFPKAPELTSEDEALTWCVRSTSAWLRMAVVEPEQFEQQSGGIETVYPGLSDTIKLAVSNNGDVLRQVASNESALLAQMSQHGPDIKEFCRKPGSISDQASEQAPNLR